MKIPHTHISLIILHTMSFVIPRLSFDCHFSFVINSLIWLETGECGTRVGHWCVSGGVRYVGVRAQNYTP